MTDAAWVAMARSLIGAHEGCRLSAYLDTKGVPTIGIGFNLDDPNATAICLSVGASRAALLDGSAQLTQAQCDSILSCCLHDTAAWLAQAIPAFNGFSDRRKAALADMGFNLGETRFLEFRQMIACIRAGQWEDAASSALDSLWAKEVPARAAEDAAMLAEG